MLNTVIICPLYIAAKYCQLFRHLLSSPSSFMHFLCITSRVTKSRNRWASYQIRKIAGCACAGNAGNVFPPLQVRYPDMHHGTCVTHVPWCMPGLLTWVFIWSCWRGKRSWHSWRMRNPQFYISGKRPIVQMLVQYIHWTQNHFPEDGLTLTRQRRQQTYYWMSHTFATK